MGRRDRSTTRPAACTLVLGVALSLASAPALLAQDPAAAPSAPASSVPAPVATAIPVAPPPALAAPALERIPDPIRLAPAEVSYVNPLWKAVDSFAKLVERPALEDFETVAPVFFTIHLLETGRAVEALPVEPPFKGVAASLPALVPKWKFTPAKKDGRAVATWATFGIDLKTVLEKGSYASFVFAPIGKEDPLPRILPDRPGDEWMLRYPKEISPKDQSVLSIEDVDFLPVPEKTSWDFDSTRLRSRVTGLVEVGANGSVKRIVPTGPVWEPLVFAWVRKTGPKWKLTPALAQGKPVDSWMTLDVTLEYTANKAKDTGRRMVKKNLRGEPQN